VIAVVRAWTEFDRSNPITWLYVTGLAATLAALAVLYAAMERLARDRVARGGPVAQGREGHERDVAGPVHPERMQSGRLHVEELDHDSLEG